MIACKDCKVVRDLDKFYSLRVVKNRGDALKYSEENDDSFREKLTLSFIKEHQAHNIIFFSENDECSYNDISTYPENNSNLYKYEDYNFWGSNK